MAKDKISKIVEDTIEGAEKKASEKGKKKDIDQDAVLDRLERLKWERNKELTRNIEKEMELAGEILRKMQDTKGSTKENLDKVAGLFDDYFWTLIATEKLGNKFDFVDENSEFTKEYVIKSVREVFLKKDSRFKVPSYVDPDRRKEYFNYLAEKLFQSFKDKATHGWWIPRNNINEKDFNEKLKELEEDEKKYMPYEDYLKKYNKREKAVKIGKLSPEEIQSKISGIGGNITTLRGRLNKVENFPEKKSALDADLKKLEASFAEVDEREIGFLKEEDIISLGKLEEDTKNVETKVDNLSKKDFAEKIKKAFPKSEALWVSIDEKNFETTKKNFALVGEIKKGLEALDLSGYEHSATLEGEFIESGWSKPSENPAMTTDISKKLQDFKSKVDTAVAKEKSKFAKGNKFLAGLQQSANELKGGESNWEKAAGKALEVLISFVVTLSEFFGKIPVIKDWLPDELKFSPDALKGVGEKIVDIAKKAIGILTGVFVGAEAGNFVNKIKNYKVSEFLGNFSTLEKTFTTSKEQTFLSLMKGYAKKAGNKGQNILDLITNKFKNKEILAAEMEKITEFSDLRYGKALLELGMTSEGTSKVVTQGGSVKDFMNLNENLLANEADKTIFVKMHEYIKEGSYQASDKTIADFVVDHADRIEEYILKPKEEPQKSEES